MSINMKCGRWWKETDYLPFESLIAHWCMNDPACRKVKEMALITALEKGRIEYKRTDGKTFEDPVIELVGRNLIAIERSSFEAWVSSVESSPLPEKGKLDPRERNTYLKIIRVLAEKAGYKLENPYSDAEAIEQLGNKLEIEKMPKGKSTLGDKLKEAVQEIPISRASIGSLYYYSNNEPDISF